MRREPISALAPSFSSSLGALRHSSSPPAHGTCNISARSIGSTPAGTPPVLAQTTTRRMLPTAARPPPAHGFENVTMTNAAAFRALRDHASALHRHLAASPGVLPPLVLSASPPMHPPARSMGTGRVVPASVLMRTLWVRHGRHCTRLASLGPDRAQLSISYFFINLRKYLRSISASRAA